MKIIFGLKSIPELTNLKKQDQKNAWIKMHQKIKSSGKCKLLPLAVGIITAAFMCLTLIPILLLTNCNELIKFTVTIITAATGGYLGSIFAMSYTYKTGQKYLPLIIKKQTHNP